MTRTMRLTALAGLVLLLGALLASCSLTSVSGGEGDKNIDVSMGGHLMSDSRLNFKAVGYSNQQLEIQNTAAEHNLDIGPGTPITTGDGTVVAKVVGVAISIAPGKVGILGLNAPLAPSQEYYLGATTSGSPSIRQMFMCPGDAGPAPTNQNLPTVPSAEQSLPTE
ncbi:MAG TPA: hypothetical protein VK592_01290 [Candidatus Dormibacteraeota bacterium]|nr:hypothetical protein [Candidatus Dormibacteraeota bacterium]